MRKSARRLPADLSDESATSSLDSRARLASRRWMEACASLSRHACGRAGSRISYGAGGAGAQRGRGDRRNRCRHARSREGQLQVELAQLNYMLPRLTGKGTAMSRLGGKSGGGGAGGGAGRIGVRGPGEKKLETDRRRIRDRVGKIQASIDEIRKQRALRREARNAVPLGTIALVGYTNAGKSTLFNALSRAEVLVSSRMFATLDPTIRALRLPSNRRVLVSDTVGFIRDLPKGLLTAFRATLEEVQEAALILHVSDVSNPHHDELDEEVDKILRELGVDGRPRLRVLNKMDRLTPEDRKIV